MIRKMSTGMMICSVLIGCVTPQKRLQVQYKQGNWEWVLTAYPDSKYADSIRYYVAVNPELGNADNILLRKLVMEETAK